MVEEYTMPLQIINVCLLCLINQNSFPSRNILENPAYFEDSILFIPVNFMYPGALHIYEEIQCGYLHTAIDDKI